MRFLVPKLLFGNLRFPNSVSRQTNEIIHVLRPTLNHNVRRAMTLPEVLVVMAVIGVLIALLVPAIQRIRESASRANCSNNMRQLALAAHARHDAVGKLPPYSTGQRGTRIFGGWFVHLLPYVSDQNLYDEIYAASAPSKFPKGSISQIAVNLPRFASRRFALLTCNSDPTLGSAFASQGTSNYLANWYVFGDGISGCYAPEQKLRKITNGTSHTVLFSEGYSTCNGLTRKAFIACGTHNFGITWTNKPSDDPSFAPLTYTMFQVMPPISGSGKCDSLRAQTAHAILPAAFADGSVRFVPAEIAESNWLAMLKSTNNAVASLE